MDGAILALIISGATLVGGATGWLVRQFQYRREAKRQAVHDAGETLKDKKTLLEEMISKIDDTSSNQTLLDQLEEVNAALLGLYAERLRHTLKEAGLPTEEILIEDGRSRLQPQQIAHLKQVVEQVKILPFPLSTLDMFVLASTYYHMQQYEEAKDIYNKMLSLNPDDPKVLNCRGITYEKLKRYDEALADFNRSLELRPDDPDTVSNQGAIYQRLGRYNEALDSFDQAIRLRPDYPEALHNRGRVYIQFERYTEALIDFNRSLELRPDHPTFLHNRGTTYAHMKRYDEALADFNRSLELRPDDPDTVYNLACLFSLQGKANDALSYLEKAISKDKKYREKVKTDKDFDNIRDGPRFKKLVGLD